jgi:putative ABC transport system ATP-binding protein
LQFTHAGSAAALHVPHFAVPAGGIGLVTGPSGSGKTTLLSLIAGLLPLHRGTITVGSNRLQPISNGRNDAFRERSIGFIPQRLFLSAALTVRQNLLLAPFAAGLSAHEHAPALADRADALLRNLGLADLASRRAHRISGGQAQRVAVARALMNKPQLLLADEPTASLDDAAAHSVIELLCSAAMSEGVTLVISSHDSRVRNALPDAVALVLPNGAAA